MALFARIALAIAGAMFVGCRPRPSSDELHSNSTCVKSLLGAIGLADRNDDGIMEDARHARAF